LTFQPIPKYFGGKISFSPGFQKFLNMFSASQRMGMPKKVFFALFLDDFLAMIAPVGFFVKLQKIGVHGKD
jgi:hypothetical protein